MTGVQTCALPILLRNFIPAVEKGLREYMVKGPLAGFPVVDFRAELYFADI